MKQRRHKNVVERVNKMKMEKERKLSLREQSDSLNNRNIEFEQTTANGATSAGTYATANKARNKIKLRKKT